MIKFIDNEHEINEAIKYLSLQSVVGIDVETRSISKNIHKYPNWGMCPHSSEMVMFQIGTKDVQYVVDVRKVSILPFSSILEDKKVLKVGTNIKFDYQRLRKIGIIMDNVYDCMVVEMIINNGLKTSKGFYSLSSMANRYLNLSFNAKQLVLFDEYKLDKGTRNEFEYIANSPFTASQIHYGANDVVIPLLIRDKQLLKLSELDLKAASDLENQYTLVIGDMEYNGLPIDVEK